MSDARGSDLSPEMLSGYLDEELDLPERAAVEARLAESAEWRAELEEVRTARLAVRGLAPRDPPAGFWDEVLATVADSPAPPIPIEGHRARRRVTWIAGVAAAVAALVAAVVIIPSRTEVTPNVVAVVAQHGTQSSNAGDPISALAPVGPLARFRR